MYYDDEWEPKPERQEWTQKQYEDWLAEKLGHPIDTLISMGVQIYKCNCGECVGWSTKAPIKDVAMWIEKAKDK